MKNKYAVAILAMCLTLTACDKSIDAKNADTLRVSIQKIGKNMTEAERMDFAQDLFAIYEMERHEAIEDVSLRKLYSSADYEFLFTPTEEQNELGIFIGDTFADMAASAGEALDGQSPKSLAIEADAVRSSVFSSEANTFQQTIGELKEEISKLEKKKTDHTTAKDEAIAVQETLDTQKKSAFQNVEVSSVTINQRSFILVNGKLTVKNTSDKHIRGATGTLIFDVKGIPDATYEKVISYKFDPALVPGASVERAIELSAPSGIKGKTERIRSLKPYKGAKLSAIAPTVRFTFFREKDDIGVRTIDLDLDVRRINAISNFDGHVEACDTLIAKLRNSIAAYEKSIEYLEQSSKSVPDSIEHKFPTRPYISRLGC